MRRIASNVAIQYPGIAGLNILLRLVLCVLREIMPIGSIGFDSARATLDISQLTDTGSRTASEPFCVASQRGPIKIAIVDIEELVDLEAHRSDGCPYAGVWCLVRRARSPVGLLKLNFDYDVISAQDLAPLVAPFTLEEENLRAAVPDDALPFISVIVPSLLAREADLRDCVEALSGLDYPRFEILLIDNRVGDVNGPPEWLLEFPLVRVLAERRPGISQARNKGLAVAKGEIVAFTDDDVVVDSLWLRALGSRFVRNADEAGVMGIALPRELETPAQLRLELYAGSYGPRSFQPVSRRLLSRRAQLGLLACQSVGEFDDDNELTGTFPAYATNYFGAGANMAFRTQSLRDLGGFDTALGTGTPTCGGEDLKLFVQLICRGASLGLEPAAFVFHAHRRSEEELRRQLRGWGIGFSAMITALILDDPNHLRELLIAVPTFARLALRSQLRRKRQGGPTSSEGLNKLTRLEHWGYLIGPIIYLRTRRMAKR